MRHKPLLKEILRPGVFVDWSGAPVLIEPGEVAQYAEGTNGLIAAGTPACAYPSHGTDDAMQLLGTWREFTTQGEESGPRLFAILQPDDSLTPEQVEKIKRLQVSAVIHKNFDNGQYQAPRVITRVDIVGAGAIPGLQPFQQSASLAAPRSTSGLSAGPALSDFSEIEGEEPKEKTMDIKTKMAEMKALMGYEGEDEDFVKEMGAALSEAFPPPAEPPAEGEEKKKAEQPKEEEPASNAMAQRLKALEAENFESALAGRTARLSAPIAAKTLERIRSDYKAFSALSGHDEAMKRVLPQLDEIAELSSQSARLASAVPGDRKHGKKPETPKVHEGAVAAMARRLAKANRN